MKAFLDTHAAAALHQGERDLFGPAAAGLAERAALFVSPVVRLELTFLHEIGRLRMGADEILQGVIANWGVTVADDPIASVVLHAVGLTWTRDPFDRLLVATAMLHRAPFITRDRSIRESYPQAVW